MPTNANTFNSRVTSEALEKKFRDVFPAQGGAELVQDLFASGVIQPVIDFSSVAEGSVLSQNLQTAWDFSTGSASVSGATSTLINNTGFWQVHGVFYGENAAGVQNASIQLTDGLGNKPLWDFEVEPGASGNTYQLIIPEFIVFLRSGDSLTATASTDLKLNMNWRQIADVNGNLTNPLGFVFS